MPGVYHKRSSSKGTSVSSLPVEDDIFQSKEPWKYPVYRLNKPPNPLQSARAAACNNEKLCQPLQKMNTIEEVPCTGALRGLRSSANYPRQACGSYTGSNGSDSDLAAMVHEFLENESCVCDINDGSESDSGSPSPSGLCEDLQMLKSSSSPHEKQILALLKRIVRSVDGQQDLACLNECKGSCVRQIVVKQLRSMGYNASICKAKWPNSQKVIGGEHEYIDILLDGDNSIEEGRIIVDLDFQSQFEIARPTQHYLAALNMLPITFVGFPEKLNYILKIMSEAAQHSLKQNSMHVPPWRTLDYMWAKWFFPCERITDASTLSVLKGPCSFSNCCGGKHCWGLLRRIRSGLLGDSDRGIGLAASMSKRTGLSLLRMKPN